MFVPLWLWFLGTGTLMAVLTVLWAVRTRQFDDQDRARYIPLADLPAAERRAAPGGRAAWAGRCALALTLLLGCAALASAFVVVMRHH